MCVWIKFGQIYPPQISLLYLLFSLPTLCALFVFNLIHIESDKCCLFVCIYLSIYRSIGSLSGSAFLKKTDSHLPSSYHLPIVPYQSLGHYVPLSHPHWYLDWLDLLQISCMQFRPS